VHNSGKYICNTTTDINHMIYLFFWIAVYLWWRYLKFLLFILELFVLADIKGQIICPCKQALTLAHGYRQGYW
jgi:hypothetical protein